MKASAPATEGTFSVFAEPQFRWIFAGNLAFFFAMNGQMVTRSILAWDLVGQAMALAYINLVVAIPMLFASLFGGAITDRIERRQIVIFGQTLLVANELLILGLLLAGRLEFWHMLVTGFLAGCTFPFIMPARMAITVSVVGPQRIQSAMAYGGGVMHLSRVAGPALMGLLIAWYDVTAAYGFAVLLYLLAVACMFGVKLNHSSASGTAQKTLLADIGVGLAYLRANPTLLACLLFGLLPMFVAMPFHHLLVMLAEEAWDKGEGAVGTLVAIGGLGGLLGSLWIVHRGNTPHRLRFMLLTSLGFALLLVVFVQTPVYYLALVPLLIANTFASASHTVNSAAVQILADDEVRGRISSVMMMSFGLMPIGVFPMAMAADHFGAAAAITGACAVLCGVSILFYLCSPALRRLDQRVSRKLADAKASHSGPDLGLEVRPTADTAAARPGSRPGSV